MKKDMVSLEAIKNEKGDVVAFNVLITDVTFKPIYKGKISAKEYINLVGGIYKYVAIESDR